MKLVTLPETGSPPASPEGKARFGQADRLALLALLVSATIAAGIVTLPTGGAGDLSFPAAGSGEPGASAALQPGAFIDLAPFDPFRRRETSLASLDAAAAQPTAAPVEVTPVIGGILLAGDERRVLFRSAPDVWHAEGDTVDGWLIRHIEAETVILTRGADIRTLTYRAALETLGAATPPALP